MSPVPYHRRPAGSRLTVAGASAGGERRQLRHRKRSRPPRRPVPGVRDLSPRGRAALAGGTVTTVRGVRGEARPRGQGLLAPLPADTPTQIARVDTRRRLRWLKCSFSLLGSVLVAPVRLSSRHERGRPLKSAAGHAEANVAVPASGGRPDPRDPSTADQLAVVAQVSCGCWRATTQGSPSSIRARPARYAILAEVTGLAPGKVGLPGLVAGATTRGERRGQLKALTYDTRVRAGTAARIRVLVGA